MSVRFVKGPTSQAIRIVRQIFSNHPAPLTTKEIYNLAVEYPIPPDYPPPPPKFQLKGQGEPRTRLPLPPHPDHPIRSISYLKQEILPALSGSYEIEKFHTTRTLSPSEIEYRLRTIPKAARKAKEIALLKPVDTWLWRPRMHPRPPTKWDIIKSEDKGTPFWAEVGVGEDWGHLNKRRQRARVGKVRRDVQFMKELRRAKSEARIQASEAGAFRKGKDESLQETATL